MGDNEMGKDHKEKTHKNFIDKLKKHRVLRITVCLVVFVAIGIVILSNIIKKPKVNITSNNPPISKEEVKWDKIEEILNSYYLNGVSQEQTYYIAYKNEKTALLDKDKNILLPAEFQGFEILYNLIGAKKDDKWGLYDKKTLKLVVMHTWDDLIDPPMPDDFKANGLVRIKKDKLWGCIDQTGKIIIEPNWDEIRINYYEQVEPFINVKKDGKYGYVSYGGRIILEPIYDVACMDVLNSPDDLIFVKKDGEWGTVKIKNEIAGNVDWSQKPREEVIIGYNNWKYENQYNVKTNLLNPNVKDGEIEVNTIVISFFMDYFAKNPMEIRSIPEFKRDKNPNWDELTRFICERFLYNTPASQEFSIEQFDEIANKLFNNISYTHKNSSSLKLENGKYFPTGWDTTGFVVTKITKLQRAKEPNGEYSFKAEFSSYYFGETDFVDEEASTPNGKVIREAMKKDEYKGMPYDWIIRNMLIYDNNSTKLTPGSNSIIEFKINNPDEDIWFKYLSSKRISVNE